MASVKGYLIANSVVQLIGANHVKTKNSQLISPAGGLLNAAGKAWNFEDGTTTGWGTYADAAGVAPVDGTGGSPNVTFAASQTLPNFGEWCGLFSKDAANRQGQGVSVDFTLPEQLKGGVFTFSMATIASSNFTGLSGTESARIYCYDVTNGALLPGYVDVAPGTNVARGFFIATTSTSYRFIIHVSGTGTSAWTLKVDDVNIGSQNFFLANSVTTTMSDRTITQSVAFGTTTQSSLFYQIVGNRFIARATWKNGTVAASAASITLPSGILIDPAYLQTTAGSGIVGRAQRIRSGGTPASAQIVDVFYDGTNTNQLFFSIASASDALTKSNGGDWASNNDTVYMEFNIPVVGYNSNIQLADRAVEEFSYNTGTWDSDNTSAFASGASGQAMGGALTAVRTKRVRFNTSIQPTDSIHVEFSEDQITWVPANDGLVNNTYVVKSTNSAGDLASGVSYSRVSGTTTDIDVAFGQYVRIANDDSPVVNWPSSNAFWRVRKIASGGLVGYGAAKAPTQTILTTGSGTYTTPAGAVRLRVRMVGGGGAGGGTTNGTGGGNTTFGTLTCNGGNGTSGTTPGVGGNAVAVGAGFSGVSLVGSSGGAGTAFNGTNSLIYAKGGDGGPSAFGGQGGGGDSNVSGGAGGTNTGSGGGGGGIKNIGSSTASGAGGGSGSYVDVFSVGTIASTYSYAVGGGGTGGGTNTNVYGGGNGGSGIIIVEEFYI